MQLNKQLQIEVLKAIKKANLLTAIDIQDDIQAAYSFKGQMDSDGLNRWDDSQSGNPRTELMVDTENLKDGWQTRANTKSIVISNNVEYSAIHESGTDQIPARPAIPTPSRIMEHYQKNILK